MFRAHFSTKLKSARKRLGITQAMFAEMIGVEPSTASRWETGANFPDGNKLDQIFAVLGVDSSFFMETEIEPSPTIQELAKIITTQGEEINRLRAERPIARLSAEEEQLLTLFRQTRGTLRNRLLDVIRRTFAMDNSKSSNI